MQLEGLSQALAKLRAVDRKAASKVVPKALRAGAKVFVREAKAQAPVDSGVLRRAMTVKVKSYAKSGKKLAIIGPRNKRAANGRNPANYAHLVELGHRVSRKGKLGRGVQSLRTIIEPAAISKLRAKIAAGKHGPGQQIGYVPPNAFMARAARAAEAPAIAAFISTAEAEILKAAA